MSTLIGFIKRSSILKAAFIIVMVGSLYSCEGLIKQSYKPLAYSKVTAEEIAITTKNLYAQGLIDKDTYNAIKNAYEKARLANSAVIDAVIVALDSGIRPEDSPEYQIAMQRYLKLLNELVNLAIKYGIIEPEAEVSNE